MDVSNSSECEIGENHSDKINTDHIEIQLNNIVGDGKGMEPFRRLVKWLLLGGAQFPKCRLSYIADCCRATFASQKIDQYDTIMQIPQSFILTSNIALKSSICQKVVDAKVDVRSKHTFIALYLLQERDRGSDSWWYPYINILPKHFRNIPLFLSGDELGKLKGSMAVQKIKDRHTSITNEYRNLCKHVSCVNKWSYEDFVWARLVVITRIFGLVIDGVKTDGLVPMADMINHKRPRETRWTFDQFKSGFVVTALKNIACGEQIFDSYGKKCNSRFFVNYGFSLENNPNNECMLRFYLDLCKNKKPQVADFQVPVCHDKKAADMLSVLRWTHTQMEFNKREDHDHYPETNGIPCDSIVNAKKINSEFRLYLKMQTSSCSYISPISIPNELFVLQQIKKACDVSLSKFTYSLPDDEEMLKDYVKYPMYSSQRNIVLMTRGEKQVMHHWKRLATIGIELLTSSYEACLNKIDSENYDHFSRSYFDDIVSELY